MLPNEQDQNNNDYALPTKRDKVVQPLTLGENSDNPAANIIRGKIAAMFNAEPSVSAELQEVAKVKYRSKHQQFLYELSSSGKSLAEIQSAWHSYYTNLPDQEKHEVWQEFYTNYNRLTKQFAGQSYQTTTKPAPRRISSPRTSLKPSMLDGRSLTDIKRQLLGNVGGRANKKTKRRSSLAFGLTAGIVSLAVMMFGFFNERFIAPFITPSRVVSSTPIILDGSAAVGPEPKLIIPKINLDVPVVYDEPSVDEEAVQRALEDGVLYYATTPKPGELGNSVIFGHSSNNILNRGKYKFAFVLLNRLEVGDTFMAHYEGQRYIYKVSETKIVPPTDVSVLNTTNHPASMTLITCDPPGTAINRLVVIGEQIAPDPGGNIASSANQTVANQPQTLPSNAPSLWSRLTSWLSS